MAVDDTRENASSADLSRPASGGMFWFQARLADALSWLGPAWAGLCGVVASAGFDWRGEDFIRLALLVLLVDGGWGTLWTALGGTDWATPLRRWREWRSGTAPVPLPYTQPGSPGDRAVHWLGQLRAWWREVLHPACGPAVAAIIASFPFIVLLGALLGTRLLLLSAAVIAVMQLGVAWEGGRGNASPGWDGLIAITFPWLAGHIAFGEPTPASVGLALTFALAWGGAWWVETAWGRFSALGAQFLAALLLVLLHRPLAVMGLALLLAPQMLLLPWVRRGQSARWYVRYTRPWLMAAMLVAAWAL